MLYTLTTVTDGEIVTTLHRSEADAMKCLHENFGNAWPEWAVDPHSDAILPGPALRGLLEAKNKFIADNRDDNDGDPLCGWNNYDETITDYARDVMFMVEQAIGSNPGCSCGEADLGTPGHDQH